MTDIDDVPIVGTVQLPPDPRIMEAIGGNHGLETALADLVDNAVDAGARRVLIRFHLDDGRCTRLVVADDGRGIPADEIDKAMTVGGDRDYDETDLGHFGWGLKAASLSQADILTLLSFAIRSKPVGRRWVRSKAVRDFGCQKVDPTYTNTALAQRLPHVGSPRTLVRWDQVRTFPSARDPEVTTRFLAEKTSSLLSHLGLTFHRFLEQELIDIRIDVYDAAFGESGALIKVEPIDPFGYPRSGQATYPQVLKAPLNDVELSLTCHIWSPRSQSPNFRLGGRTGEAAQGFYFYRRNRLLQAGGWNQVEVKHRDLQLARVAIELDDQGIRSGVFSMNPEKSRIEAAAAFSTSVERAQATGGTSWSDYLSASRAVFKQGNQRTRTRPRVLPPGRGFAPSLRKVIATELEVIVHEDPVDIRWERLAEDVFFSVDRDQRTIWLNKRYRWAIAGEAGTSLNDAPLVKALIYLLIENVFQGSHLGPRDKDNIELWQSILITAAKAQAE